MFSENRVLAILAFAAVAMLIFCAATPLAAGVAEPWTALVAAGAVMLAAIPVHCMGSRRWVHTDRRPWEGCWLLSCLMNSVSNALAAAAFYIHTARAAELLPLMGGMLPGLVVLCVAALLLALAPERKEWVLSFAVLADVTLIVLQFILPQGSWEAVFGLVIALFYMMAYALTVGHPQRPVMRNISFGSFGAAMVIGFIALVIVSEGEALEGVGDVLGESVFEGVGEAVSSIGNASSRKKIR